MTDKQIIETLKNIKRYCNIRLCEECAGCKFILKEKDDESGWSCQIRQLTYQLAKHMPRNWDMEKIERIINK